MSDGFGYGVLMPCYRCRYAKSHEPILIFSKSRGVRIIVNLNGITYVRKEGCLGFDKCGKCFEVAEKPDESLPCKWDKLSKR